MLDKVMQCCFMACNYPTEGNIHMLSCLHCFCYTLFYFPEIKAEWHESGNLFSCYSWLSQRSARCELPGPIHQYKAFTAVVGGPIHQ